MRTASWKSSTAGAWRKLNQGDQTMPIDRWLAALVCSLLLASTASAQVLSGVMTVTGAEMH